MPTNGLFSRVLKGGTIQLNDSVEVLKEKDKTFTCGNFNTF